MKRKLAALVLLSVKHWISAALKSLIWTGQPVMAQLPKHPPPWFSVFEPMDGPPERGEAKLCGKVSGRGKGPQLSQQPLPFATPDRHHRVRGVWDFKRMFAARNRWAPQTKAI